MGRAENWQSLVEKSLGDLDIEIFNPRRDDWDSSWKQSITDLRFREQVEWELSALEAADFIAMYFAPQTQAPITLLELGLFARSKKVFVACPEGYWRKGNIEIVCARFTIPLVESLDELIALIKTGISSQDDAPSTSQ